MAVRSEARTRSRQSATAGDQPSSCGRASLPPADEDHGFADLLDDSLFPDDEEWPGSYGAARLGIP